jgi:hypothetical protein
MSPFLEKRKPTTEFAISKREINLIVVMHWKARTFFQQLISQEAHARRSKTRTATRFTP